MEKRTFANLSVLDFYKSLPFNYKGSLEQEIDTIRNGRVEMLYPGLSQLLSQEVSVLEVGCGIGWLSNSINYLYNSPVVGIDFNPVAIERACQVARIMKLKTKFLVEDLFLYEPEILFHIVISFGVLHHTDNCAVAVRRLCERFVCPGGYVIIGLYHKYGRQPFLDYFNKMKERGVTEEEMFAKYSILHSQIKDKTQLISWFRDQVFNPHETQHTLAEMLSILQEADMELVSTSINHFQPIKSNKNLIEEEYKYRDIAIERLKGNQYFPGFFVFIAK